MYDPYSFGGPASHLRFISEHLSKLGCEVHILTYGRKNIDKTINGVQVHYLKNSLLGYPGEGLFFSLFSLKRIRQICRKHKIEVVHGQSPSSFGYALFSKTRLPFVVTMHGTSFGEISALFEKPVSLNKLSFNPDEFFTQSLWALLTFFEYRLADKLIAVSNATAQEAKLFYGLSDEKVKAIPNGVDLAKLSEDPSREERGLILSVGRLVWRKGFHYLINAMPRVLSSFPNAKLCIVGEGPERAHLNRQVKKLRIENSVNILDMMARSKLDSLFLKSAVYVQPSLYEPLATTVLEAMSFGKAIVATRVVGLPEAIQDKVNGLLVEPEDSDQLSDAIITLLSDPILREKLGRESLSKVERKFSWDVIAKQTLDTYEDVLKDFSYGSDGFMNKLLYDNFDNVFFRGESLLRWKIFQRFFNFTKEDVVTDLGGGSGGWTKRIAPLVKNVILVDVEAKKGHYENSIHIAKKKMPFKNVDFLVADVNLLPLRSGCIHKALMNQVLEHVDRPSDAFRETSRVLGENGIFVTSTPYAPFLKRYKFPITKLLRKILPRNLRHANNRFLIGEFVKTGYTGWMKETGHMTLGFSLSQIQDLGEHAGLKHCEHDYLHKGICVWFWELGYCLPFVSFVLRPVSRLLYAHKPKSSNSGLDVICRLQKNAASIDR